MNNFGMRTFFLNLQLCRNPELLSKGKIENRKIKRKNERGFPPLTWAGLKGARGRAGARFLGFGRVGRHIGSYARPYTYLFVYGGLSCTREAARAWGSTCHG